MAVRLKSELIGYKELQQVLKELPDALAKNALSATARAGANELRRIAYAHLALAMASRSPRDEDISIRKRRTRREDVRAEYGVGPPKRKPQLRWLHDGTRPHTIVAMGPSGILASRRMAGIGGRPGSGGWFGTVVDHPGQLPQPWLEAAVHSSSDPVMKAMAEKMVKALGKQAKKLASAKYSKMMIGRITGLKL